MFLVILFLFIVNVKGYSSGSLLSDRPGGKGSDSANRSRRRIASQRIATQFPDQLRSLGVASPLYYDSMLFTPEGLRHLVNEVGASQIMLGTDGNRWNHEVVDRVLAVPELTDADRIAILGGTAAKLL